MPARRLRQVAAVVVADAVAALTVPPPGQDADPMAQALRLPMGRDVVVVAAAVVHR